MHRGVCGLRRHFGKLDRDQTAAKRGGRHKRPDLRDADTQGPVQEAKLLPGERQETRDLLGLNSDHKPAMFGQLQRPPAKLPAADRMDAVIVGRRFVSLEKLTYCGMRRGQQPRNGGVQEIAVVGWNLPAHDWKAQVDFRHGSLLKALTPCPSPDTRANELPLREGAG